MCTLVGFPCRWGSFFRSLLSITVCPLHNLPYAKCESMYDYVHMFIRVCMRVTANEYVCVGVRTCVQSCMMATMISVDAAVKRTTRA